MRTFLVAVSRNPLSLFGSALTTGSALLILTLFALELVGFHGGPYMGILAFLILPGVFLLGLVLVPVGVWFERRRQARQGSGADASTFPVIDLNVGRTRKIAIIVVLATSINVVILAMATDKGVEVMESNEFCGSTCHTVMSPEFTTYQRSPHARVSCVACRIGPGANWFVKSKLSGSWQVVSVALELYPRPIPTPVHNLRPARETCEQCHWPSKFVGDRLKVRTSYAEDEENTELKTVVLLKIGGSEAGASHGIHWHVDRGVDIRYRSDEKREVIHEVEMTLADGTVKHFRSAEAEAPEDAAGDAATWRTMDCVDCHNRPTHVYRMPEQEINQAILEGRIDRSLPFIRREGLRALQAEYSSLEQARAGIGRHLAAFYGETYPDLAGLSEERIQEAAQELGNLYGWNVFPDMRIAWGTYPNHVGHQDSPGCFRCHDDEHRTREGEVISQDCSTCHSLLAIEEESPEFLSSLE